MNFLQAVNRVLRSNGILRGDDDDLTAFAQTQHAATSSLAQISIQDQLGSLVSDQFITFEEATADLTMVQDQRLYSLPSDFIRFQEEPRRLAMYRLDSSDVPDNSFISYAEEADLRRNFPDYRDIKAQVDNFYFPYTSTAQVGMWKVPDGNEAGTKYRFYYEKDVSVTAETDSLPFHSNFQANIFVRMASRHFSLLFQQTGKPEILDPDVFEKDSVLVSLRGQLLEAIKPHRNARKWIN